MSMIGKTLGNFECAALIGRGGMGEVYQAKDRKLGRDVAIKVLPEEFAKDADRVARFQREAKLLASLNHPNIAAIYGLEESAGTNFLVLELVEGDTLADRIKAGPIPVEESLKLVLQIAEALEAAHEKGVIHRDLKPANIKVTPDDKVKVLDFGLAKAYAGDQEVNLSNSPTLSDAATRQGVILGTAAYMSPEQARGKPVDKRTDIWAFGCVLFEMLTGQAAFQGEDVTEILAAVVKGGADLDLLPANIHPRVREVIIRCLQKEQKKRYGGIGEAQYEMEKVLADPSGVLVQPVTAAAPRTRLRAILPWAAAALVLGLIIAGVAIWKLKPSEPRRVIRFVHELPEGQQFSNLSLGLLAVSPDGKQFVYSTRSGLYARSMDMLPAKLIAGTEGPVQNPFFSPDGQWVGYFSVDDRQLKKISIYGGAPVSLCAVNQLVGAWWHADNTIVYAQSPGDIMRISAGGGTPKSIVKAESKLLYFPQILPDGKSVLYSAAPSPERAGMRIVVRSLESGETKELFPAVYARYLKTGHIVYEIANSEAIMAVPFDLEKLEVTGAPVPVIEGGIQGETNDTGTMVYIPYRASPLPEGDARAGRSLVWLDRKGKEEPLGAPLNIYRFPKISPEGSRVATTVITSNQTNADIWIWDLARKTLTRLTFEGPYNLSPVWTPDGKRIAFLQYGGTSANGAGVVYWKAADGSGKDEPLGSLSAGQMFLPHCWTSNGKILVGTVRRAMGGPDIEILSIEGDHARKPLLRESYIETQPTISPDGRWIAYASDESRKMEIYVRPFPDVDKGRWQISTNGGDSPLWSPDGRELFYRNGDSAMAVSVKTEPSFSVVGTPQILFRGTYVQGAAVEGTPWDIHPDGKRFLMIKPPASTGPKAETPRKINIVINWFDELKQRVPVK